MASNTGLVFDPGRVYTLASKNSTTSGSRKGTAIRWRHCWRILCLAKLCGEDQLSERAK